MARPGSADTRQDHVRRSPDARRICAQLRLDAQTLQRITHRADIRAAAVDQHDVASRGAHSTPFVLGKASPSRRTAWRSARAVALKQASTM